MSPEDIRKMSVVRVETPDTYDSDGYPIENGLMDPRLGVLDPSLRCHTCGVRGGDCQGHFGSIELARPVLHVGFGDIIHKILRSTCNECGRVLLPEDVLEEYREKISDALNHKENLEDILKKIQNDAKKVEMNEAKQNDIVNKIMDQIYPDDADYDEIERDEILLNILNQLYAEAYMIRDESEEKPQFSYIDPKMLCPHCRKNQPLADIEANYDVLETKNTADINKIKENIRNNIESDYAKKIAKIDKKLEELQNTEEIDSEAIEKLELKNGDAILFERGSIFRFKRIMNIVSGITYGCYGEGMKPALYGSPENYAENDNWEEVKPNIWKINFPYEYASGCILDYGMIAGVQKWDTKLDGMKEN